MWRHPLYFGNSSVDPWSEARKMSRKLKKISSARWVWFMIHYDCNRHFINSFITYLGSLTQLKYIFIIDNWTYTEKHRLLSSAVKSFQIFYESFLFILGV